MCSIVALLQYRQYRLAESIVKLFKRREGGQKSRFFRTEKSLCVCFRLLYPKPESEKVMKQRSYSEANTGSHLVVRRADIFLCRFKYQRQSKTAAGRKEKAKVGSSRSTKPNWKRIDCQRLSICQLSVRIVFCSHCTFTVALGHTDWGLNQANLIAASVNSTLSANCYLTLLNFDRRAVPGRQ